MTVENDAVTNDLTVSGSNFLPLVTMVSLRTLTTIP